MNIVFDIGNVLVRWDLGAALGPYFPDDAAMHAYLDEIGFHDWNRAQDAGRSWAEGIAVLQASHGERAHPAITYPAQHAATIAEPIEGSWTLLERLRERGHPLYAITNWSAEGWPEAVQAHPRLGQVFRDVVVSGQERLLKPEPAIFRVLLERNGLQAGECLFIDDSAANVDGAKAVGMDAVQFTDPPALEAALASRGLL